MNRVVVELDCLRFPDPVRAPGGTNSTGGSGETWFTRSKGYTMFYHVTLQLLEIKRGKETRWVHASNMLECTPLFQQSTPMVNGPTGQPGYREWLEPHPEDSYEERTKPLSAKQKRLANLEKARAVRAAKLLPPVQGGAIIKDKEVRNPRNFTREDMGLPSEAAPTANPEPWRGLEQMGRPQ